MFYRRNLVRCLGRNKQEPGLNITSDGMYHWSFIFHSCIIHVSSIYHAFIIHVSFHILLIYGTYERCVSLLRDPPSRVKAPKFLRRCRSKGHELGEWQKNIPITPPKTSRVYIFQPLIFRGHVSFQGSTLPDTNISPLQIDVFLMIHFLFEIVHFSRGTC